MSRKSNPQRQCKDIFKSFGMRAREITISRKVMLSLVAVLVIFLILEYLILYKLVQPGFATLQTDNATQNAARCHDAINAELSHLSTVVYDWAAWDDTHQFVQDGNARFLEANISEEMYTAGTFDMVYICNLEGNVVYGEIYDPEKEKMTKLKELPSDNLGKDHWLLNHSEVDSTITGLLDTNNGLIMISSRPVVTSEAKGPIKGSLIIGRFLNSAKIKQISEQINVDFSIVPGKRSKDTTKSYRTIEYKDEEYAIYDLDRGPIRIINTKETSSPATCNKR